MISTLVTLPNKTQPTKLTLDPGKLAERYLNFLIRAPIMHINYIQFNWWCYSLQHEGLLVVAAEVCCVKTTIYTFTHNHTEQRL